jgi:hypothetical protein
MAALILIVGASACDIWQGTSGVSGAGWTDVTSEGRSVAVTFLGEIDHGERFSRWPEVAPVPLEASGLPEGEFVVDQLRWLEFEYQIGAADPKRVLVAKEPIMRWVSWDAIARAGAALGDGSPLRVGSAVYQQDASIVDREGRIWRVRLMRCGRSTHAEYSEWNLLIGGVHEGDVDFVGARYGWHRPPFNDEDLHVGYQGSLTWCQENWRGTGTQRVARGYFHVSRFHAADSDLATDRLSWRPVLELVPQVHGGHGESGRDTGDSEGETSPDGAVRFRGILSSEELLGRERGVNDHIQIARGSVIGDGQPDWLQFEFQGKTLLVAARPVLHSVSWNIIAEMGAALGDESILRLRQGSHPQNRVITDLSGHRYRVRLLRCGGATLDTDSEWNRLIGAVHEGDGDFVRRRDGLYGWVEDPLSDQELYIGEEPGSATWCMERVTRNGREYAVNRGYLTVSRFHMTEPAHSGTGFGWRPVLERIDHP